MHWAGGRQQQVAWHGLPLKRRPHCVFWAAPRAAARTAVRVEAAEASAEDPLKEGGEDCLHQRQKSRHESWSGKQLAELL